MTIDACIFDLDGVIVDTAKYHFIAWREIAKELGFSFTEIDNERLKGVSRMRSLDILLEIGDLTINNSLKTSLAAKKNEHYLTYIHKMLPDEILPGAIELLQDLKKNNVKTALGSASKNAMTILNRLAITDLFDVIIDGNRVSNAKPNPEVFLKGAIELNIKPANCIVFEDAEAGIEAALSAGMKCIGIGNEITLGKANMVVPGLKNLSYNSIYKSFK